MKIRLFIALLFLSLYCRGQVPDSESFSLQDVINEVSPSENSLNGCFTDAVEDYFNQTYKDQYYAEYGSKNNLLMFRDYGSHNAPTYDLTDNLIYYYKLNDTGDTITDEISGYNITNSGGQPSVAGKLSTAYELEKEEYAKTAGRVASSTVPRTLSLWLKVVTNPSLSSIQAFCDNVTSFGYYYGFSININSTGIVGAGYSYGFGSSSQGTGITDKNWHNITIIQKESTSDIKDLDCIIYVDGEHTNTLTGDEILDGASGRYESHWINRTYSGTETTGKFIIDDIKIWSKELSIGEIQYNYNSGNGIELE